jgi:hypothetical protein
MLTHPQVQRYTVESGLRDNMIAEKEVVLTFLLQLLSERGILARMAFKGGTCLRKMFIGSNGRFSTDLDFTGIGEHDHEDVILDMMAAFEQPFHGIQFAIPEGRIDAPGKTILRFVVPIIRSRMEQQWRKRGPNSGQPPRNADIAHGTARADRAELFQAPSVCAFGN